MKEFKNKVLVVTGAGSGIGAAIAKEGALRGMKTVLADIDGKGVENTKKEILALGGESVALTADVSILENVQKLHDLAMGTYGQVDFLVNNAGVAVSGPIWEIPVQDINWITEVNLLSHAYGLRVFLPQMIRQGTPSAVVNVSSGAGLMISPSATMYHTTKFADVALSESTFLSLKDHGFGYIQMHVLCPAFVRTGIHQSDLHRPERYASMGDPYYQSQEYKSGLIRSEKQVLSGIPIDTVGMTVFTGVEENKFYILTHPEILIPAGQRSANLLNGKNPS